MIVVLDSNILLSALITPAGPPGQIYRAWRARRFELATCETQIEEIRKASHYTKFSHVLQPHSFGILINNMHRARVWNAPLPQAHQAADPQDSYLLNLAEAANADYLITGDVRARLLERMKLGRTHICTARHFCDQVLRLR